MPQKTVIKSQQFDCPKCARNVTFEYREIQEFADELPEPIHKQRDRVTNFGRCQVAAQAKIPYHPIAGEMDSCPFYQAFFK